MKNQLKSHKISYYLEHLSSIIYYYWMFNVVWNEMAQNIYYLITAKFHLQPFLTSIFDFLYIEKFKQRK